MTETNLSNIEKLKIDEGIDEGIADIEAGRSMELRHDNIEQVLSKPISDFYVASAKLAINEGLASKKEVKILLDSID
jgi:hypothetical protein